MESNNTSTINTAKQHRINQLQAQIKILEEQLEASKRDLRELQKSEQK